MSLWFVNPLYGADANAPQKIPPQAAGSFYPADPKALQDEVDAYLAQASTAPIKGEIVAALVPHAGYVYSAATAARVFKYLQGKRYETVIVLASGHHVPLKGAATVAAGSLSTPLGEVPVDAEAVKTLQALCPLIETNPAAFRGEHAVEVQLPFLQRTLSSFKLVPMVMNTDDPNVSRQVGEALAQYLKGHKAILIISSDLSHYPDKKTAHLVDTTSLTALVESSEDPERFWKTNRNLMERGGGKGVSCTYCGEAGVLSALFAMKVLGASGHLLHYTNSGESPGGDPDRTVGYAALLWLKGAPAAKTTPLLESQKKTLLALARNTLKAHLEKGDEIKKQLWDDPAFNLPAAVFVTLRRKDVPKRASLRGCIGSLVADQPLAEAVQAYAIESALRDPRFDAVTTDELPKLSIEISRLTPFRRVSGYQDVKPGQGVTVRSGFRSGLFLPQVWEDLPDKTQFLEELCSQKAGLPRDCYKDPKIEFRVFDAEVMEE